MYRDWIVSVIYFILLAIGGYFVEQGDILWGIYFLGWALFIVIKEHKN